MSAPVWQGRGLRSSALLPVAWLFGVISRRRRRRLEHARDPSPLPVLVIGNLNVGGTGKTPLVAAIATHARTRGIRCGIVSRGYGGRRQTTPRAVSLDDDPTEVGDEPLMLRRLADVPVTVCTSRVAAVAALAERGDIDLVLADDGLQHYAMARAGEICVIDATTGLGNARLLPAGPLREPASRLSEVDIIALRGDRGQGDCPPGITSWPSGPLRGSYSLIPDRLLDLHAGTPCQLQQLHGRQVHAVAGIGRPQRLFDTLQALGAEVVPHAFPDHHRYRAEDLTFADALPIVTTSKDAVKIARLPPLPFACHELRMRSELSAPLLQALDAVLDRLTTDENTLS